MAYQGIGTGTLPNDNTGDNLRDAGIKINDNFSEIYNHFGDGTNLTAIVGTGIATESGLVGAGVTLIDFRGSAVGEVVVESGIATITVSDFQESLYGDTDVNAHLNLSSAGVNEVLSYDGSDYTWVSNAGYTNSNVDTHLNRDGTVGVSSVLSWDGSDYAWVEQSGGSDGVVVQEEGSDVGTATTINFVGTGVTATFDSGIATVSIAIGSTFSGDYTDLTNKPTIPTNNNQLTNGAGYITAGSTFSGNYNDLSNKPTIPADTGDLTNNVGFITAGDSGAGLTALTGADEGTYGNATNAPQITVDANGRITSISAVAISGGGGGGGISGINVFDSSSSLGITTIISFNDNLDVVSIGDTFTVSVSGVVTSLVGYATEGYVDNAVVGLATTGALVGFITSGALIGYATEGYVDNAVVGFITSGALVGYATEGYVDNALVGYATEGYVDNAVVGFITAGGSGAGLTALTGATQGTYGNATNSAQIEVDANGRITSISAVAISGGGGGGGISGVNVFEDSTSLGVTTHIAFNDNLTATSIGNTVTVSVTGITGVNTDTSQNTYAGIGVGTAFGANPESNTLFGYNAGKDIVNSDRNTFFGSHAGKKVNADYNTAIGAYSLSASVSGTSNVAIGYQAANDLSIGGDNVFVGAQAGRQVSDSNQSVVLGAFAAATGTTLNRSIAIGDGSCYQGGTDNIGIGVQNLQQGGNSQGIIGIGYRAARYCAGNYSIHIGVEAGRGPSSSPYTTGDHNLSLGHNSLTSVSTGYQNIAIGHSSGGVTTGSNNIILGNNAQVSSGSTSNQVIIGDSNITKFSIPGIGVTLKDNGGTPTQGHVLTVDANGEASFAAASGGGGGSGDYSEVAGIATYTSEWTLGADGINHYTFTGPGLTGAENDPALYLTRGQQYKFYNNSGGHPFRIQSTPNGSTGTQYNDGILTNDVGAGSTLTWDVQFDAPNKLYYQCTSHPNMGGPIYIIPRTEPAVGVRTEVSGTTGSVGAGATTNLDIDGFKSYGLLKVGISSAAWVRLYVDTASRTSDASRSYLTDPSPGSGLIAEVRTETAGISTFLMTPGVIGWNNEVSIGSSIYAAVTNNESSSATITVDLTVVKMED